MPYQPNEAERLAILEEKMREHRQDMLDLKAEAKATHVSVNRIELTLAEFRGSKKALFGMLAAASGFGALAMAFITYVWPR